MLDLKAMIGHKVLALIPFIDKLIFQEITLHGVECGGIWVESQNLTNMMLQAIKEQSAPKTIVYFLPWHQISFLMSPIDTPALNEKSFGV
jgi:hypothetical protein